MGGLRSRRLWILASPGSAPTDVIGPFDVFRRTADFVDGGGYDLLMVGAGSRTVHTDSGIGIVAQASLEEAAAEGLPHTVVVGGGDPDVSPGSDEEHLALWLREHAAHIPRIASVCTGAFILGRAGLLDGRRATTHWALLDDLQERFPSSQVAADGLFVVNDKIWTSAGLTSGMDMSLAMVEADFGHEVSLEVARFLVLFLRRTGNQPQYSSSLAGQVAERRPLRELQAHIVANLDGDLSIERLAESCHMSPRNLSRAFKSELGVTIGAFVRSVRLDEARRLLETTDLAVAQVASTVGAGDESTLRRWFLRHLGVSPTQYKQRFRAQS